MSQGYRRIFLDGSRLGRRQFNGDGIRCAGLKRSLGFVIQPVENWSRYPELHAVMQLAEGIRDGDDVLDLGSPKMLGFLLAQRHAARFRLTDLWDVAVDEVRALEERNRAHLAGTIELQTADLTDLSGEADASYDWVYSVSVIEHIEDPEAIRRGLREMARVLRPGGRLLLSVPVSPRYRTEYIARPVYGEGSGADEGDGRTFFSHYFDRDHLAGLLAAAPELRLSSVDYSRWNTASLRLRIWRRVPRQLRGLLGWVNLALAPAVTTVTRESWEDLALDREGDVILALVRS